MAGVYGSVRSANFNPLTDAEIFYYYRPTRGTVSESFKGFKKLSSDCLVPTTEEASGTTILGLYTLKLPLDKFNMKGFYTVYIRPKEIETTLDDVSVLAAYPDVKGVVINLNKPELKGVIDLTGYRIDYFDDNGDRTETVRLITSCNRAEPVMVTVADSYPKSTRYRLTDTAAGLAFCTVTPSSANSFKPNVNPYIGVPGGKVMITNTKFNPVLLEIETIDHDADTLTYMIAGDQVRNRDKAIITTYNDDKEIYMQQDYYTVKNQLGNALYDVKRQRTTIDGSQTYDNVID